MGKRVANNGDGWREQYETIAERALASLRPNTKRLLIELLPELRIVIDMLRCEESETTLRGTLQKDITPQHNIPICVGCWHIYDAEIKVPYAVIIH